MGPYPRAIYARSGAQLRRPGQWGGQGAPPRRPGGAAAPLWPFSKNSTHTLPGEHRLGESLLTETPLFPVFSTFFFNSPLEEFNNRQGSNVVTPFLASHRRNQQFERTLVTRSLRGCCGRGALQLERCLDGDLSRNEAAPGCISERRELAPLRVAVPVFHGTPHAFPQPSRPHSDVCCPAGVSWHHERRRKRPIPTSFHRSLTHRFPAPARLITTPCFVFHPLTYVCHR